jgi:hypothetical protein
MQAVCLLTRWKDRSTWQDRRPGSQVSDMHAQHDMTAPALPTMHVNTIPTLKDRSLVMSVRQQTTEQAVSRS